MPRPSDEVYEKLQWFLQRMRIAEDYCRPYFDRAKRHYRLYRHASAVNKNDWPYVNHVRSRDILAFIEDSTAMMVQTLFGSMPFYAVLPRETSLAERQILGIDSVKIGSQIEKALDYQVCHEDTEFFEEITDFIKGGCIFGTSYIGVYPKFVDGVYLRPLLKTLDFWDVLPIPGARRISKARGVFAREFMPIEELKGIERSGTYQNVDDLERLAKATDVETQWHKDLLAEIGVENYDVDSQDIEVLHYFSGGHVVTIAGRAFILRDSSSPNPNTGNIIKPFPYDQPIVQYKYMPVPLEWFGMGIPEVLEVLQEDKNLIRSARRDNIDLTINKIIKARAGADINYDLIKSYPGAIWPVETIDDLQPWDIGDVTQSSYAEEEKLQFDMENALSLFGYARGMTPTHEERPTTVIKLQQAALNRLDLAVKLAEFTVLQNIATRIILLTRRYMPQQVYESIIGEPDAGFYRMNEEQIRRFYFFKPIGSSITHVKEIRQQQIQCAIQMLMTASQVGPVNMMGMKPFTVDWFEAIKTGLEVADIKNIDKMLVNLSPEQGQMAMSMLMPPQASKQEMQETQAIGYGGK